MLRRVKVVVDAIRDLHGPKPAVAVDEAVRRMHEQEQQRREREHEVEQLARGRRRQSAKDIEDTIRRTGIWLPPSSTGWRE